MLYGNDLRHGDTVGYYFLFACPWDIAYQGWPFLAYLIHKNIMDFLALNATSFLCATLTTKIINSLSCKSAIILKFPTLNFQNSFKFFLSCIANVLGSSRGKTSFFKKSNIVLASFLSSFRSSF